MKKTIRRFISGAAVCAVFSLLFVSCSQNADELKDFDISELYGYTFYGNITASSSSTLTPSLILYNDERADWNMSVGGMASLPFYYYAAKNSKSNYTLYWFGGADYAAAMAHDKSKAAMTVQLGINDLNEVIILLTGDKLTEIGAMQNTRVPMTKQKDIPHTTDAPAIAFDPSIQDVMITIPSTAQEVDWPGANSYDGTFDYLVGPGGNVTRGHGTCGPGITPQIILTPDGTHTIKIGMFRFAYTPQMSILPFDIDGVKVFKHEDVYYLECNAGNIPANKADGSPITLKNVTVYGELKDGKLTLRVSFNPGAMSLPVIEIFKS